MLDALANVLPFTVGIIISPVPILAAIIVAGSRRRFTNGPAFLGGWFVGLLLLMLLFSVVGAETSGGQTPTPIHGVELALGLFLWWLAWREWRNRKRKELPKWVEALDEFKARNAAVLGFLLASVANPKNIPLTAAAGTAVAESDVGLGARRPSASFSRPFPHWPSPCRSDFR